MIIEQYGIEFEITLAVYSNSIIIKNLTTGQLVRATYNDNMDLVALAPTPVSGTPFEHLPLELENVVDKAIDAGFYAKFYQGMEIHAPTPVSGAPYHTVNGKVVVVVDPAVSHKKDSDETGDNKTTAPPIKDLYALVIDKMKSRNPGANKPKRHNVFEWIVDGLRNTKFMEGRGFYLLFECCAAPISFSDILYERFPNLKGIGTKNTGEISVVSVIDAEVSSGENLGFKIYV